jgi:stage III sporulation protein AG
MILKKISDGKIPTSIHSFDIRRLFKKDNLIILILMGVLLFIIALPYKSSKNDTADDSDNQNKSDMSNDITADTLSETSAGQSDMEEYAAILESRLEAILSDVDGVGKVKVMVTLSSSEELVIEKDKPSSRSQTNESDTNGGTRVITQTENNEETVYTTEGNASYPYVVKTIVPQVEGVVVVGEGCGKGSVDKNVTEIVQALFGLEAHKVKVVKMSD